MPMFVRWCSDVPLRGVAKDRMAEKKIKIALTIVILNSFFCQILTAEDAILKMNYRTSDIW